MPSNRHSAGTSGGVGGRFKEGSHAVDVAPASSLALASQSDTDAYCDHDGNPHTDECTPGDCQCACGNCGRPTGDARPDHTNEGVCGHCGWYVTGMPPNAVTHPQCEKSPLLRMAVEDQSEAATRQLQSESPQGLAHSAITAMRRGEDPSPEAQASLDSVLSWRESWGKWWEQQAPLHAMHSRHQAAQGAAQRSERRAGRARASLEWYGGPLGDLSEHEAGKRLRGAFAQHRGLIDAPQERWHSGMQELRSRLTGRVPSNLSITPTGTKINDLDGVPADELPREPLIAAYARVHQIAGIQRAAQRWATAVAKPIFAEEAETRDTARATTREMLETDPVDFIGREAVDEMLAAARTATAAGVRISTEAQGMINQFGSLTADRS